MPKPLHVSAFEHFNNNIQNQIEAFVAFGLFMESERLWAQEEPNQPTEATYRTYHRIYLIPHETERYKQSATQVLSDLANEAIDGAHVAFLADALHRYRVAASTGHAKFRWRGVVEATAGALTWTLVLILFSVILAWQGIDIIEYYQRATHGYQEHEVHPKP
jgi:hypothetical protein